ncbi:hypothetical protein GGR54DRAFT_606032 [Hypoxylon sp. NC1633]|nr:hypothetical protein GGR54DRAFT_606032 [Hypoxylon sp. NC1633]
MFSFHFLLVIVSFLFSTSLSETSSVLPPRGLRVIIRLADYRIELVQGARSEFADDTHHTNHRHHCRGHEEKTNRTFTGSYTP